MTWWWRLPALLRGAILGALFAVTTVLTWRVHWGQLPATPFYPVVLLSVALGTEAQGYVLTALAVVTSIGLAVVWQIPSEQSQETMDSAVLALVGVASLVAMRQRRSAERLMKHVVYETGVIKAVGTYALTRLSREDIMRAIVRYLANSTDADCALVAMPDTAHVTMTGYLDANGRGNGPQRFAMPIATSVSGIIYRTGRAKMVPNTEQEPAYKQFDGVVLGSMAGVPLLLAGQPIGVLLVGKRAAHGFSQEDVRLLETMARTLAVPLYASRPARADRGAARAGEERAT